jgi:cytochrome c-type protein NapC
MDNDPPIRISASDRHAKHRRERKPRRILSVSVIVAFVLGIVSVAVFNMAMTYTSTEEFCIGCHEMKYNHSEYKDSVHSFSRTGVRATCTDCHLPKEFVPKILHKIKATNDILHSMLGTIDTPEKFEERRVVLAQREWDRLKANDSRECRDCHTAEAFDLSAQVRRAVTQHEEELLTKKQTCIDCHKGIVHDMPKGIDLTGLPGKDETQQADPPAVDQETKQADPPPAADQGASADPPKAAPE